MSNTRLSGSITAMATPFNEDGSLAVNDLEKLVESQISAGINGLLPVGTTGESPTLNHAEQNEVFEIVVKAANKRVPVIAGAGSNSTREAVSLTKHAMEAGVDATLHVTGYYNKPSHEGLFQHFSAVAEETDKPIILYSIPGRCVIDIPIAVVERLLNKYPHVNHIKESGGDVDRVSQLKNAMGDDIVVLSGDDSLTLPYLSIGGEGVISVTSNLFPAEVTSMVKAAMAGDFAEAQRIHYALYPMFKDLFIAGEASPTQVKRCLEKMGVFTSSRVRLPLVPMTQANEKTVLASLEKVIQSTSALANA